MDTAQSLAALVEEGPAIGQLAGGWDCIDRTKLRAWIETKRQAAVTGWSGAGYEHALDDLEDFVNGK